MKKILCLLLTFALTVSMLAACGSGNQPATTAAPAETTAAPETTAAADDTTAAETEEETTEEKEVVLEKKKIAVANFSTDSYAMLIQNYYNNYIGPAFNVEFMFSESTNSAESIMTFIESAYAAGCDGIINYSQDSVDQVITKANELGLYLVTDTTSPGTVNNVEYNLGYVGATVERSAEDFSKLTTQLLDDGKDHNVCVLSGGAGLGKKNDLACTVAGLQAIADFYGFEYEEDVNTLAATTAETECKNNGTTRVTIYPGYANTDTYVPGLSTLLQSGDFDIILCNSTAFSKVATAIDEVEQKFNMNIKIMAKAQVNDTIATSFHTLDSFGDTFLTSAILTPSIGTAASLFAVCYNGITGYGQNIKNNGEAQFFDAPKWVCYNAKEYEEIEQLNVSDDTWELTVDDIKTVLGVYNENVSYEDMATFIDETGNLQAILERRGF